MPLMAHKDNGFKQAQSGEISELEKAGWERCDDPMEYKQRVWGIGVKVAIPKPVEDPIAIIEEPATMTAQPAPRRVGRPRNAEQEPKIQEKPEAPELKPEGL